MPGLVIDRRYFLGSAAATATFFAMHDLPVSAGQAGGTAPAPASRPRLLSLELQSGAPMNAMKALYKGGSDQFTAMGDEYGLLLVMKRGRIIDFTGETEHGVRVYRTAINVRGPKATKHQFAGYPYRLDVEERCSCG